MKISNIIKKELLDFLVSKGYSEIKILEYLVTYGGWDIVELNRFTEKEQFDTTADMFLYSGTPEGLLYWIKFQKEYEQLNK